MQRILVVIALGATLALPNAHAGDRDALAEGPVQLELDPDTILDLRYSEPTALEAIAKDLEKAIGVRLVFDPNLRTQHLTPDFRGLSPAQALSVLAGAARVFFKPVTPTTLMVAADTPQNRREYEEIGIRVYTVANVSLAELMTTLRSIVDARRMAAIDAQSTLIVRDSAAKLAVIDRLVEALDGRAGAAEVQVNVLEIDQSAVEGWSRSVETTGAGATVTRATIEQLVERGHGRRLAAPILGVRGGHESRFESPLGDIGVDGAEPPRLQLELRLAPSDSPDRAPLQLSAVTGSVDLRTELAIDQGGSYLLRPGVVTREGRELVVGLTLLSIEPPAVVPGEMLAWWVGTEVDLRAPTPVSVVQRPTDQQSGSSR